MNVLVTGGAGFVGSVCTERLIASGNKAIVLDNLSTGHRSAVPPKAVFIEGDFGDTELCNRLVRQFEIDTVMHFAGETLVEKSMTDSRAYFLTNVKKGIDFLNVLVECGVKSFVFSSTAAVYGEPKETPITENHPKEPINSYGESKLMFEKMLEWYRRAYGLNYIALRYFNAAGASDTFGEDHHPESHLIPRLLQSARRVDTEFVVFGNDYPTPDGTCIRDYVHVRDIAEAHVIAADALKRGIWGAFNIGTGTGNSIKEVISTAAEVLGRPLRFRIGARREGDPAVLVASNEKLSKMLGWKPESSTLREIVGSAWRWNNVFPNGYPKDSSEPEASVATGQRS
jgi:UDP-glucose 4-epimerase